MLKVFLVEDEFVIREGIKNNIDWESHGYEFCGEASDGELAFPMIQKLKPDIVITDIRMPFMDGLTLCRLIKKEMPWIEIIILSGYEEFEYAKEGINLGIAGYLLKPISGEELLKEIDKLSKEIENKQKEQEIKEKYEKEMEENYFQEKKALFQYLVTGDKTLEELLETAHRLEIDLSSIWYNIVLFKAQSEYHAYNEYSNSLMEIDQKIESLVGDNAAKVLVFDRNLEGKAFLFKADSGEELSQFQVDFFEKIRKIIADYKNIRYFGGIGTPVNRIRELPISFEKASHAFAHRYLVKDSLFFDIENIEQKTSLEKEEFDIGKINSKQIDRGKIQDFLKIGDKKEVVYFVDEFFKNLNADLIKANLFWQYIIMDSYFCIVDFVEGLQMPRDEIETPDMNSSLFQNAEGAKNYVVKIMQQALILREKASKNRYDDVVREVIEYIEKNYMDENLSLNLLASHVNFSPNHLSTIFSQQTGQTLIKYLTDFRMNKAKELLRCTGKRSSVVSTEVGYKDPHYFSYLFKKTQGMTPTQYRSGNAERR